MDHVTVKLLPGCLDIPSQHVLNGKPDAVQGLLLVASARQGIDEVVRADAILIPKQYFQIL